MTDRLQACRVLLFLTGFTVLSLSGCQRMMPTMTDIDMSAVQAPTPAVTSVIGEYVSDGYAQRAEGYDWTRVTISAAGDERISVKVRSRSDIKKPTCTFDGSATLMGQDIAHGIIFETKANDSTTFLQFKADKLVIDSKDKNALYYFCSGGASLAGEYQKIAEKA